MKKLLFLLLCIGILRANAQIQIGSAEIPTLKKTGKISKESYDQFEKSTTLFTLQYKDYAQKADFEKAIASVWTVTPFKIIRPEELSDYYEQGYSVFMFGGYLVETSTGRYLSLSYDLTLLTGKKNGKVKSNLMSRTLMATDNQVLKEQFWKSGGLQSDKQFGTGLLKYMYNNAVIYNWSPGLLKGYLNVINQHLTERKLQGLYDEVEDKKELPGLKTDTLFVPDYATIQHALVTAQEKSNKLSLEEIQSAYPYPVKIIPSEELSQRILNGTPGKYLVFTPNMAKYVSVYDCQTGKLIWTTYKNMAFNLKAKDFKRLAKDID